MKYIQNRNSFHSGLITKEEINQKLSSINEAWTDKYDTLPNYKDSYGGRLLSFIFRKGNEKINSGKISKVLTDLENAINESIIENVKKNDDFAKKINNTEKKSFFSGIWDKFKSSKNVKDIEKVNKTIEEQSDAIPVDEYPMSIQIIYQYLDQRVINITNNNKVDNKSTDANKEKTDIKSTDDKIVNNTNQTEVKSTNTSSNKNFIIDLLSSKNPVQMLSDKQIKKQFFVDLKVLMNNVNYKGILLSHFDDKLKSDLNKLSIFNKNTTIVGDTTNTKTTTNSINKTDGGDRLSKINKLKQDRLKKQDESKNKPVVDKKDILGNIDKIESKNKEAWPVDKTLLKTESVDDILSDTLSLRDDTIKNLVKSLNMFFDDKRIPFSENKQTIISKFFSKVNKLYNEYFGNSLDKSEIKSTNNQVTDTKFDPNIEVTDDSIQSLMPVLYKKMDSEEKEEAKTIIKLLNKGVKIDGDTIDIKSDELDKEVDKATKLNDDDINVTTEMDKEVENSVKSAAIDPLEIVRIFNRANKIMVVNRMPSNRSENRVSNRVINEYETLDGGSPSPDNNNGPYRNKILWNKWNDGVLSLMKKYKEVLNTKEVIIYSNGKKEEKVVNEPIIKFMNDMLNDCKATGGKEGHQRKFIESYFGLTKKDSDSYERGNYGYNDSRGDIFNINTKTDKEITTSSNSSVASYTSTKKDGTKVSKIVLSKMRDVSSGYSFSFQGKISGIKAYDGKVATIYCIGIKVYGKDHILFKMSINNDWFIQAYNVNIRYTPEREEDTKTHLVYLMLTNYSSNIVDGGFLNFNCIQSVVSEKIQDTVVNSVNISNIKNLRILSGSDGLMMKMGSTGKKTTAPKDNFYDKKDTFNNIYDKLKNVSNQKPDDEL